MKIKATVVTLPIKNVEKTLHFYKNVFNLSKVPFDSDIVTIELPNLSLFLMTESAFLEYSEKANRGVCFPNNQVANIISCSVKTVQDVDLALEKAPLYGGSVPGKAKIDDLYGSYMGYMNDPDGHLWELVCAKPK